MKYKPFPSFFQFLSVEPHGNHFCLRKTKPQAQSINGSLVDLDCVFVPEGYLPFLSMEAFRSAKGVAGQALYKLDRDEELLVETDLHVDPSAEKPYIFNKVKASVFAKMLDEWMNWRYSFSDIDLPFCPVGISEEMFTIARFYTMEAEDFSQKKTYREVLAQLISNDPMAFTKKPMTRVMLLEVEGCDGEDGKQHQVTLTSPCSKFYGMAYAGTQELADLTLLSWKIFRKEETDETKTNAADGTGTTKPSKRRGKPVQRTEATSTNPSGS